MTSSPSLFLLVSLTLAVLPAPTIAAPITGRTVKTWMEDAKSIDGKTIERPPFHAGMLQGFLLGLTDGLAMTRAFCPPPGLGYKGLLEFTEKFLEHDYANRDKPAAPRIAQQLRQVFPCAPAPGQRPKGDREQAT